MVDIVAKPEWKSVRILERDEVALGGYGGNMNEQATALVARTELLMQEKADASDIVQGQYSFSTLAEFDSKKATIPANSVVIIDEVGANQGTNTWDGTTLTKSVYDPVEQSKNFTLLENSNLRKSIESDIFVFSSNLFDKDAVTPNTSIDTDGTIIEDSIRWLSDYIPCSPSDVFSLTSGSYRIAYFDENKNFISLTSPSGIVDLTIPTNNSIAYFRLSATTPLDLMQLNTGSTLLPYEPYFQKVKEDLLPSISPEMTNFFDHSNNLFNKNSALLNTSIELDGTIVSDATRWLSDYIACSSQEVFSLTNGAYRIAYFDANKNFIERSGVNSNVYTILRNSRIRFMRLSSTLDANAVMLNRGDTLLPYEVFSKRLHPELLPNILPEKLPVIEPTMTSFFETSSNLFNKSAALLNTSINEDGSVVSDSIRWLSDYIPVTPDSNISLPNASFRIACYDPLKNFINRVGVATVESDHIVYTTRSDTYFIRLSGVFSVSVMHMNHGNALHPFEEFGEQYINNDYLRVVETSPIPNIEPKMTSFFDLSRNLFNKNTVLPSTSLDETGVIVADPIRWLSDYIECTAQEVFSLPSASYRVAYYDKDKNFIIRSGVSASPITVLNRPAIKYMRLSSNVAFETLMLNKGSTLLPYEIFGTALIKPEYLPTPQEIPEVDIDQIADEVQQRIGTGLNWEPSFPKLNFSIVESGTYRTPMWMNELGTIIYGAYGDQLLQSTDEWATRTQIGTTGFVRTIAGIRTLDDGELLISTNRDEATATNSKVYKTIGYDRNNPSAATFKEVLTTGAAQENINNRWGLSVYQNICVASGYGLKGPDGAQNVYLSTDYGDTWRLIFNLRTQVVDGRPPLTDSAHMHTVAYDPYFNRIWVCVGDNPNTATYYSDDLGETWTFVEGTTEVQYTGIIALPDAVVFGSDRAPNGVFAYQRKDRSEMPVIKPLFLINDSPTITHVFALPFKKDWLPDTPVYFAGNKTTTSVNDKPVIMGFVDGKKAHLLYEHTGVDALETALGPTAQGNIISAYSTTGVAGQVIIKAKAPTWQKL